MSRVATLVVLLVLLAAGPAAARPAVPADSLFAASFRHWPVATQRRLAASAPPHGEAPRLAQLLHTTALAPPVRAWLTLRLGRAYIHEVQPALAAQYFLEARQLALALPDSTLYCEATYELCYAYQLLQQPRKGLACGEEVVRLLRGRPHSTLLTATYTMMGECAMRLRDYPLAWRCYRASRGNSLNIKDVNLFIYYYNIINASLHLNNPRLTQSYFDSAVACVGRMQAAGRGLPGYVGDGLQELEAKLALRQGDYACAVALLAPLARRAHHDRDLMLERGLLESLPAALTHLGRYREALTYQNRYIELLNTMYEEQAGRQAQQLQALYDTRRKEQEVARQRQRIGRLQAQAQQQAGQSRQRLWLLGAVLVIVVLALGLALAYQRSRHRLAARAAAQHMRDRIAADLHDEVGTLLTRVNLQAEVLRHQQPAANPALDRLLANSRAAAGTMRDIVWGIDAQADTVGALLDRMRDHLYQLTTPAGLATELKATGLAEQQPLPAECRQHLYLIFKEAVANAVRHAPQATQLTVTLARHAGQVELLIENDGPPTAAGTRSGMGLRNMQQRAAALRGQVQAGPLPGGGFRVQLTVPGW